MNEKHLLPTFFIIGIIAFVVLTFREAHLADPKQSDWWSLSFVTPNTPEDASFSVSNFGTTKTFFYEVTIEKDIKDSASFVSNNGDDKTIIVKNTDKKPVRIIVWTENEANKKSTDTMHRKEIYQK